MTNIFSKAMESYKQQQLFGKLVNAVKGAKGDIRYNTPKEEPKAAEELVEETIENTEIYKRAKEHILNAQRKQVAYGLDKYPEPLNADTWSTIETIDHIIDESIDKLHYLVMLRIKLERKLEEEFDEVKKSLEQIESGKVYVDYADGLDMCSMYPSSTLFADNIPVEHLKMYGGADMDGDYIAYAKKDVVATEEYYKAVKEEPREININVNINHKEDVDAIAKAVEQAIRESYLKGF